MIYHHKVIIYLLLLAILGCSRFRTRTEIDDELTTYLAKGEYTLALQKTDKFKEDEVYQKKDRILFYLNKGLILHYQGDYKASNEQLEIAEQAMEELFTRSISNAVKSVMINDNLLDYTGEVYDNLYVNVFKALNYLRMNNFEDSYVEINRVNDKLQALDLKYGDWVNQVNQADTTGIKIENKRMFYYENVLSHYLSYLVYRYWQEIDNSRISYDKIFRARNHYPTVYDFPSPQFLMTESSLDSTYLNIITFTGRAPLKYPVGGEITTFDDFIVVTDVSGRKETIAMVMPGLKEGYHFKFAFPEIRLEPSVVQRIEVILKNGPSTNLELIEDMGKVAAYTFETKKNIIYFKTITRSVVKGLAAIKAKDKLQDETKTKDNFIISNLINLGVDAIFDATENPDLRVCSTFPRLCFTGEIPLKPGNYQIKVLYYGYDNSLLQEENHPDFTVKKGINLLETVYLN
jgi:uncharacterized protein